MGSYPYINDKPGGLDDSKSWGGALPCPRSGVLEAVALGGTPDNSTEARLLNAIVEVCDLCSSSLTAYRERDTSRVA